MYFLESILKRFIWTSSLKTTSINFWNMTWMQPVHPGSTVPQRQRFLPVSWKPFQHQAALQRFLYYKDSLMGTESASLSGHQPEPKIFGLSPKPRHVCRARLTAGTCPGRNSWLLVWRGQKPARMLSLLPPYTPSFIYWHRLFKSSSSNPFECLTYGKLQLSLRKMFGDCRRVQGRCFFLI